MKKMMINLAIALCLFATTSFANNGKVDPQVLNAFNSDFQKAEGAEWNTADNMNKVSFNMNGQFIYAYYTNDGNLQAMSKHISFTQLPLHLQLTYKQNYTNFWVNDLYELSNKNSSTYYLTIENADETIVLKSNDMNNWTVQSTVVKA